MRLALAGRINLKPVPEVESLDRKPGPVLHRPGKYAKITRVDMGGSPTQRFTI